MNLNRQTGAGDEGMGGWGDGEIFIFIDLKTSSLSIAVCEHANSSNCRNHRYFLSFWLLFQIS